MKNSLTLIILIFLNLSLKSDVINGGNISGRWIKANSPYLIQGDITVLKGSALTIEAGVRISFLGHYKFKVFGLLIAEGTNGDSITFSANNQDKGWGGIQFENADKNCELSYCIFEDGKSVSDLMDHVASSDLYEFKNILGKLNIAEFGGAIRCINSSLVIEGCTFRGNEADHSGGAIFACEDSDLQIRGCSFSKNIANRYGGGALAGWHSKIVMEGCSFFENSASKFAGGAIDIEHSSILYLTKSFIYNNTAFSGGGINLLYSSQAEIRDCHFSENSAKIGGGLNFNEKCGGTFANCSFKNNYAVYGGGIAISEECQPTISDCNIRGNRAKKMGGGIFIAEVSSPSIFQSKIINNISEAEGGGIYCQDSQCNLGGCKISHNIANNTGGGIFIDFSKPILEKLSIHENEAIRGGGIFFENCSEVSFSEDQRCSIYQNRSREIGNDLFAFVGPSIRVVLDTFTVKTKTDLHAYPSSKFNLETENYKILQINKNLYVSTSGSDINTGLSESEPLKHLNTALSKIQSDSLNQRIIYLADGEYDSRMITSNLSAQVLKWIKISPQFGAKLEFLPGKIMVYTPWWNTIWAYMAYIGIFAFIFIIGWRIRIHQIRLQHQAEMDHFRAEKLEEIDRVKSRFFANISHEFRTPLTLILGPIEKILSKSLDKDLSKKMNLIQKNTWRLKQLVDQLLDLSKLEAGAMKLQARLVDLAAFLKPIISSFSSWAERKNILIKFVPPEGAIEVYLDPEMMEKVINNLLFNALKFTPDEGKITINIHNPPVSPLPSANTSLTGIHKGVIKSSSVEYIQIRISDTGPGIPLKQIPYIFDRFYQADSASISYHEGSGIGLALSKELVELHHGEINVESQQGKGSSFIIILPLGRDHLNDTELATTDETVDKYSPGRGVLPLEFLEDKMKTELPDQEEKRHQAKEKLPLLLIVEDNSDMRQYMVSQLDDAYRVITAVDGKDGFEKSGKNIVDLVISDIMMPEMDGFQFCKKLKTDERTSHIPVILLTARADSEGKLEGLDTGADDYLTKPFDIKELKSRVKNLIEQRRRLKARYSTDPDSLIETLAITSIDQQFLQKLVTVLGNKLSDPEFSIEDFAREMALSSSHLYRKIHSLTGHSPSTFIRIYRLKHAACLLRKKVGNVTQVAFDVGFNNLAYFSRCFKEQFGESPAQYVKSVNS